MTFLDKSRHEYYLDGTLLKKTVSIFNKEKTEEHFIDVLEFLRDSYVWIPCNAVLSDVDMAEFEKSLKEARNALSSMVGKTFSNKENICMIPSYFTKR